MKFLIPFISDIVIIGKVEIVKIIIAGFPPNPSHIIPKTNHVIGGITCKNSIIGKKIRFIISYFVNMTVHNILAEIPKNNPNHILASVFIISSISKGEFIILNRYFNTLSILGIITGG